MKKTIFFLFFFIWNFYSFAQSFETRNYNGKYNQETATKKLNEYIKITQTDKRLSFIGEITGANRMDGIWTQKVNETDKITVNIRYLIEKEKLTIQIIAITVSKNGKAIMLSPESTNEAVRKAYQQQVKMYTDIPFSFMMIEKNIPEKETKTANPINKSPNSKVIIKKLSPESSAYFLRPKIKRNLYKWRLQQWFR